LVGQKVAFTGGVKREGRLREGRLMANEEKGRE